MATKATKKKNPDAPQRRHYKANTIIRKSVTPRLKKLIAELGGTTTFAKRHGLNPKYVYRWTSQGMVPNTDTLIRFGVISNVSPEWLLFGRGTMFINGRKPKAA